MVWKLKQESELYYIKESPTNWWNPLSYANIHYNTPMHETFNMTCLHPIICMKPLHYACIPKNLPEST